MNSSSELDHSTFPLSLWGKAPSFATEGLEDEIVHSLGQRVPDQAQQFGPTTIEDSQIAAAVLAQDRKATSKFVARYATNVYGYIHARVAPRYD